VKEIPAPRKSVVAADSTYVPAPELPSCPPYFAGREIISLYRRIGGLSSYWAEKAGVDLLKHAGISDSMNLAAGNYSHGIQAKLGASVAMAGHPELFMLDEPASGKIPDATSSMKKLLTSLASSGVTILLSSYLFF
jgi:ABC-2 type transport system ATP-binding protein